MSFDVSCPKELREAEIKKVADYVTSILRSKSSNAAANDRVHSNISIVPDSIANDTRMSAGPWQVKMDGYQVTVRAESEDEAKKVAFEKLLCGGHSMSPKFDYGKYAKVQKLY